MIDWIGKSWEIVWRCAMTNSQWRSLVGCSKHEAQRRQTLGHSSCMMDRNPPFLCRQSGCNKLYNLPMFLLPAIYSYLVHTTQGDRARVLRAGKTSRICWHRTPRLSPRNDSNSCYNQLQSTFRNIAVYHRSAHRRSQYEASRVGSGTSQMGGQRGTTIPAGGARGPQYAAELRIYWCILQLY